MSIPRSDSRSSTLRSDSGYFTYIITARRIISGELLKYRKGLLMTGTSPNQRWPQMIGLTMPAKKLIEKKPFNLVAVALANKMARIAFAILRGKTSYREIPA